MRDERDRGSGEHDPVRHDPVPRVDHRERDEHGAEAGGERGLRRRAEDGDAGDDERGGHASTSGYTAEIDASQ